MQQPHRPGPLHQTNKAHKGTKRSRKSSAASEIKSKLISKCVSKDQRREERLNQAIQNRKLKCASTYMEKRCIGIGSQAPLVIGILGSPDNFLKGLVQSNSDDKFTIKDVNERIIYVVCSRLKMRFKIICLDQDNFEESLDMVKGLDLIMLLHKPNDIESNIIFEASDLLSTIYIHCLPTIVHVIDGYSRLDSSTMIKVKRILKSRVGDDKLCAIENDQDYMRLFHILGSCKRQKSAFKEARAVVSSDTVGLVDGKLVFSGFVRNKTLNPNSLVHIQGYDDYQIEKIVVLPDIISIKPTSLTGFQPVATLLPDPMKQETLDQENELDPMEGEQTWPTAEELATEAERQNVRKVIKKLPPGTSEYQGAWINESDEDETNSESSDDYDDADGMENEVAMKDDESDNEFEDAEIDCNSEVNAKDDDAESMMEVDQYDLKHANDKEMKVLDKLKEARMEEMFPDEIDTPLHMSARARFARYRGLKSFRTSHWDPQENLPPDYSRIFQFSNFQQAKKRALGHEYREGANAGQYVHIYLKGVPDYVVQELLQKKLLPNLVCLLKHERKMTVMNFLIKRLPGSDTNNPIRSKEELIFYVGFRKFTARPLFTAHSISSKFKYERFLRDDTAMVATVYAPITFPPAPVLVFRPKQDGTRELVASGSVLDSNPNRLIIKRIRLSGHPYKIFSKSAVIRFMFFNSEDVLYFKPVELITKYNRRGHITEPLGTHGHMKCTFDKKIRSDDCIFMNLYKRVFPRWDYKPLRAC